MNNSNIIIGTRGSGLALAQSTWIKEQLEKLHPRLRFELKIIKTKGDRLQKEHQYEIDPIFGVIPLPSETSKYQPSEISKGLFTKELESALFQHKIHLAVHSLKDLPTEIPAGLKLACIPKRASPYDVLITHDEKGEKTIQELPPNAKIATGSPRRKQELLRIRPDLQILDIRGNIDSRIKKLQQNTDWSGIILASAGLERLRPDLNQLTVTSIPSETMLPAPGQGALGIETRTNDDVTNTLVALFDHLATRQCVETERAFLKGLGGGCQMPLGTLALHQEQTIHFSARLHQTNGKIDEFKQQWLLKEAPQLAFELAQTIKSS